MTFVFFVEIHVHTEDGFLAIHAKSEVFRYFFVKFRSFGSSLMEPHWVGVDIWRRLRAESALMVWLCELDIGFV